MDKHIKNYCYEFVKNNSNDQFITTCKKENCNYLHLTGEELTILNEGKCKFISCEFCNNFYSLGLKSLNSIDGVYDFFTNLEKCPWNCKNGKIDLRHQIITNAKTRYDRLKILK